MFTGSKSSKAQVNVTYTIGSGTGFRSAKSCVFWLENAVSSAPIVARFWRFVQPGISPDGGAKRMFPRHTRTVTAFLPSRSPKSVGGSL